MKPNLFGRDVNASCSLKSALPDFAKPARSLSHRTGTQARPRPKFLGHNLQGHGFPVPVAPQSNHVDLHISV